VKVVLADYGAGNLRSVCAALSTWPTPATTASGSSRTAAGSVEISGDAPARSSAAQTLRRFPAP